MVFKNVSMTGTGLYILLLNLLFQVLGMFGIQLDILPGQVEGWAEAISALVALVLMVIGQVRRKDLVGGLVRR